VERAHHHIIASRVPGYQLNWLTDLAEDGQIFEFFTSDAGYLPMRDFRFTLLVKESFSVNRKSVTQLDKQLTKQVLDRVQREGPLMVSDFEYDRQEASSGWWDWRPAKVALERLYLEGKLMVSRTKSFQKIYDLPFNLIPEDSDLTVPTAEEYARYVIKRTLGALGIASVKEMSWRARFVKGNLVKKELEKMLIRGELQEIRIEELKSTPLYIMRGQEMDIKLSDEAFILSPFDVLNVFRHRLKDFFSFDYQIECFVPAAKRKYGYFSLPILVGDRFIARMDAKADRKQKSLIIHNLHFEEVELTEAMIAKVIDALEAFMTFNGCRQIMFNKTNQQTYVDAIRNNLH
jgi:uncharacterized protein YcaQ